MRTAIAGALAGWLALPAPAGAQDWPARPVTMVVTFAAGTAGDVVARVLAPRLAELLGKNVIIENVPGAGGVTGAARVARAPPDGYQFVIGTVGTHAITQTLYKTPPYNAATDFAPVALAVEQPIILIARKDLPGDSLQDFIAYAKVNQSRMSFGSGGNGTANHLACALLDAAIGINVTHVPYRSTSAIQDLIGGRIDYACNFISAALPLIEGKQIKALAVLAKERSPTMPWLASAHEQGLANFDASSWNAIFLPRGTPAAIVQRLHDAVVATLDTPAVQTRLKELGGTVVAPERRSSDYLQKFVESEIEKWAGPIKAAGVTAE